MYDQRDLTLKWILCVVSFFIGIVLPNGHCQNAEPRGYFGNRNFGKRMDLLRDSERFNWDVSLDGERVLEENTRSLLSKRTSEDENDEDTDSKPNEKNKNVASLLPVGRTKSSSVLDILNTTLMVKVKDVGSERRLKKNRRPKESRNNGLEVGIDVRKNEIRGSGRRSQTSTDKGNSNSPSRKSRYSQTRKFRAERRRRRKNRDRKRGRKRSRLNDERKDNERRASNFKKRPNGVPPSQLVLQKLDNLFANVSNITDTFNVSGHDSSSSFSFDAFDTTTRSSNLRVSSSMLANGKKGSSQILPRRGDHDENVERELSKQLEKEIARSGMINLSNRMLVGSTTRHEALLYNEKRKMSNEVIDDRARFGSSRYDAEKMLGYSRTEEDLPILDLENQVLARTMKDYNDYMTSNLKLRLDKVKFTPSSRSRDQPPIALFTTTTTTTTISNTNPFFEGDHTKGDLSCINGTFLPAPLARHALIKYVKSSTPGHEYLEAEYECAPGFYMDSTESRLLCKNHQWIGQVPKCKLKQAPEGVCSEVSCEHVCKEIDGKAVCSCYNGFRLEAYKCIDVNECEKNNGGCEYKCVNTPGSFRCECPKGMKQDKDRLTCIDINECLLNNGHGPCQDTCRNLIGGYECSCKGLQDTILSADNHTCQDAGPCSVNNAGCSHTCLSTMGRVFCLCPDGFMLKDDWKTCQDVDECTVPDLQTEVCRYGCINTQGSYRCAEQIEWKDQPIADSLSIACLPGYEVSADGSCVGYSKPRLECPKDVVAELAPGRDEAFVTFDQPSTDLDWFRYVRSRPSWGTRLEANLRVGIHEVTFFARHPVSKKQANCVLRIIVKEGEAPKVKGCPGDIEVTGDNGTAITWTEPIFIDNVKVTRISNNESPGRPFDVGGHRIEYEAYDEAGWSSKCVFTVVLRSDAE